MVASDFLAVSGLFSLAEEEKYHSTNCSIVKLHNKHKSLVEDI